MTLPISDIAKVQINLATNAIPSQGFGVPLVITDDEQIPIDLRVRTTSLSGYASELTGDLLTYASELFGQAKKPSLLRMGRYVSAATSPYWIAGSAAASTTVAAWNALTTSSLVINDSASHTVTLTVPSLASVTDKAQVPGVINTALAALVTPAITGLDDAEFSWDAMGRLILTHTAVTGAAAVTLSIGAATTAGLLTALGLTSTSLGTSVSGYAAETPAQCLAAIRVKTTDFWATSEIGMDQDDQVLLSTAAQSYPMFLALRDTSTDAANTAIATATDLATELMETMPDRTAVWVREDETEFPQAAVIGRFCTEAPGLVAWTFKPLTGVAQSFTDNLTAAQKETLASKRIQWLDTVGGSRVSLSGNFEGVNYSGVTLGAKEIRLLLFSDFATAYIQTGIVQYKLANNVTAFDAETLAAVEGLIDNAAEIGLDRNAIVDTEARPITKNLPTADDFTASDRASHVMNLLDCFVWPIKSAVSEWNITGAMVI